MLPEYSALNGNSFQDALIENTQTPVPDQVSFRCDFPRWLSRLDERKQQMAEELMVGEPTQEVARRHGVSPARISQLRREYQQDWRTFCDELPTSTPASV